MASGDSAKTRYRFAFSAVVAVIPAAALLYLMTTLILPIEGDPTVNEMIAAFELRRLDRRVDSAVRLRELELADLQEFKPPERPEISPELLQELGESDADTDSRTDQSAQGLEEPGENTDVDWRQQAQIVIDEMSAEDLRQWRLSNGYDPYRSVMQGSMPRSPYPAAVRPAVDPIYTQFRGSSGKMEVRISDECIMEIDDSALAGLNPGMRIPPRVDCKRARFAFDRDDLYR